MHNSGKRNVPISVACNRRAEYVPDEEAGALVGAGLIAAGGASAAALACLASLTPVPVPMTASHLPTDEPQGLIPKHCTGSPK